MSVVIRLKVPIEMHYTVIPMGTSKVNSFPLEVTNINFLIAHFATIYENIISLHVSLTFGTVCQTVLSMSVL